VSAPGCRVRIEPDRSECERNSSSRVVVGQSGGLPEAECAIARLGHPSRRRGSCPRAGLPRTCSAAQGASATSANARRLRAAAGALPLFGHPLRTPLRPSRYCRAVHS
jgi:hypothetical protein